MQRYPAPWRESDVMDVPDVIDEASVGESEGRREPAAIADVARCPVCHVPMQPVMGRRGPYVHCLCWERGKR